MTSDPKNPPLCKCHGEPMGHDRATWYCRVKKRETYRRWRARNLERERTRERAVKSDQYHADPDKARERARAYYARWWHAPYGGWYHRRTRQLSVQRSEVLDSLAQLKREEEALLSEG